ncbi:MAG: hypothetical protein U9Q12_00215 [Patescibacteria group bacterium]|nr:hypothetical protein [Patescibacteria group bacterium]
MNHQKQIIYIFGNPLLKYDNTPLKLQTALQNTFANIDFIEIDPNENLRPMNGKLTIIDTVADIDNVIIIDNMDDIDSIERNPNYSLHDLDLGFTLKLLKKIGTLKEILIFGVPQNITKQDALDQLIILIKDANLQN